MSEDFETKYFTPSEVELHNAAEDCWVSWLGYVYNLTSLVADKKEDPLAAPILRNAGKDISHWFDKSNGELRTQINPLTNCLAPYTPEGPFFHVPPLFPTSSWAGVNDSDSNVPWWMDKERYCIGRLSQKTRKMRIINTLTQDEHVVEVASEESLSAIQERYMALNAHAKGYMWKRLGQLLDMSQTLDQNGIKDDTMHFQRVGMDEEKHLPAIHLYFSDDLTVA
ncbi:hypothetical protein BC832DRAFT_455042 [Gaertneriomyces semiglobifer]|nr:hypothetical protein BC832DRAFT_455042 [Gaertneriomyces semiglobifer]